MDYDNDEEDYVFLSTMAPQPGRRKTTEAGASSANLDLVAAYDEGLARVKQWKVPVENKEA